MDDERRAILRARRAALRQHGEAAARAELSPVLEALDAAGAPYRLRSAGEPQARAPSWLAGEPGGAIAWERRPPDVWEHFARDPAALQARAEAGAILLKRLAPPDADVEVVFAGCALSLTLAADVAGRHLAAISAVPTSAAWLFSPGAEWLIELGRDGRLLAREG
ncbi:hypothetical protein [Phenylobacterium conjunctum]|uniref:Uncharacterized protein n=1 Tax=Phenylobacterium conjunctum TaxID=1298959 RepID=A0ABW3SYT8_9CAUL